MNYDDKAVQEKIRIACELLQRHDTFLLENDLNERSITHKLAEYLQQQFPEYHVDCEYNRMRSGKMDEMYIKKILKIPIEGLTSADTEAKTVYPDIIIHKRGTNDDNLVAIEVKKSTNKTDRKLDFRKLNAFKTQLKYVFTLFIEFDNKGVKGYKFV